MEVLDQKRAVVEASVSDAEKRLVALKSQEACMLAPAAPPDAGTCVSVASQTRCPRPRPRCALRAHGETVLPVGSGACSGAPHAKFDPCRVEHLVGGASRRDEWRDRTCLGIEFQIVRRCRASDGDHWWHMFVKVRVAVSREAVRVPRTLGRDQ